MRRRIAILGAVLAATTIPTPVSAQGRREAQSDDELGGATVIFARRDALYRTDPRGKDESELVKLPSTGNAKPIVRALRTDSKGTVLIVDVAGKWWWMPLDGSASSLTQLPCADGPAQLDVDGIYVLCRATKGGSVIHTFKTGKQTPVPVPVAGARLVGQGVLRALVWADANGVWSSPPGDPKTKTKVAPEAPLRGLLPSPDGARAIGTYADIIHDGRQTKPAELLMVFGLDGKGARRKTVRDGVPVEWSFDAEWVLVQDRANACVVRASGGDYKCWRGYTGASISADGRYALVLGNRDGSKKQIKVDAKNKKDKKDKKKKRKEPEPEPEEGPIEPSNEPELAGEAAEPVDDVLVAPPSGPLALYRVKIEGAHNASPTRIVKVIDGAAVWVPGK